MNGLLNLLTLLAALLNFTTGCGLRPSRIGTQGLLQLGSLEALSANLGGGTGGRLLSSLGALAVAKMHATSSTGGSASGATIPVSGVSQLTGVEQTVSQAYGGAVLVSGGVTGNPATSIGIQPVGSTTVNIQSSSARNSAGAFMGNNGPVIPSGTGSGGHPGAPVGVSGIGPGGVLPSGVNQVQGFAQSVEHVSQTVRDTAIATGRTTGSSGARTGVQPGGNTATNLQPAGGNQVGSGFIGGIGVSPMGVGSGIQETRTLAQSVHQTSQAVRGTVVGAGGAVGPASLRTVVGGNTPLNLLGAPASPGGGAPITANGLNPSGTGSVPSLIPGNNQVSGLVQGTREIAQELGGAIVGGESTTPQSSPGIGQMLGSSTQSFRGVASTASSSIYRVGAPTTGQGPRPIGAGPGPGPITGSNSVEEMVQGTRQISEALGGTIIGGGRTTHPSAPGTGQEFSGSSSQSLLSVTSRVNGVLPGVPAPNRGMAPGLGEPAAAPGLLAASNLRQGLGQGISQIGEGVGETMSGRGSTMLQTTTGVGVQMLGSSTQNLQGVGSTVSSGIPGGGVSSGGIGQSPSGSGPGWNPGQGSGQHAQPTSQMPGGGSYVSVSTSSHSSSSYHAHVSGATSVGGLPTSTGGGGSGSILSSRGGGLLGAIITAGTRGAPQGGPGAVGAGGLSALSPSVGGGTVSNGVVSGIGTHRQVRQREKMSPAAVAGLTLGSLAGAVALGAIGATLAGAAQSGGLGGGRRLGGCSRGGCSGGCGRKRRSISQSRVAAEVLNNIQMNFDRLY
ncbi:uncharacterized protein LOC144160509 isoform X2 [Haemaphysalis longicornis]